MSQPFAAHSIGEPFLTFQTIESTNNYALKLIHEGLAQPGTAIFTHEQTAGRGQRGKTWLATADENIIMSVILRPDGHFGAHAFAMSCCFAVGACRFFQNYTADETFIKWPNDLYWRDRKAGGILVDTVLRTNDGPVIDWVVAGFGMNINQVQFPEMERQPVSLRQITGKNYDPVELAHELCRYLQTAYSELLEKGVESMIAVYNEKLYKRGQTAKFRQQNKAFELLVQHVNVAGELIAGENGQFAFRHGDLHWV